MKISHGRYYYDFFNVVEKLRREDDSCYICGSTKNVKPHHIRRVKESDPQYAAKNNIVLLCGYHHGKFHQIYGSGKGVNRSNFNVYVKKEHLREINKLKNENNEIKELNDSLINRLDYFEQTIENAIETERTELGSNTLKHLAANLIEGGKIE